MRSYFLYTILLWMAGLLAATGARAQPPPYHINGNAFQENCNCYTLTDDVINQSGSVWNINKIDLTQSFDFRFNVFLGCRDSDGADGIAFVLQPISTSIGSTGGGMGYDGISPSLGITIDTWQNTNHSDPPYDHIAIQKNGDVNHSSPNNLAGPVQASNINIEDCQWHIFRIIWDAPTQTLVAQIDFKDRVQAQVDLVGTIFNGNPLVYWGMTGSTGGSRNRQRFCTSLNPGIASLENVNTCFPQPITFSDSSTSFGSIQKWYWDFGDGTRDSVRQPAPHVYPAPGLYEVKLAILGSNGCVSDTFKRMVTVGSPPQAKFGYPNKLYCSGVPVIFTDSSSVQFGSIISYNWSVDNGAVTYQSFQPGYTTTLSPGNHTVELRVNTREGCVSAPFRRQLDIASGPELSATFADACVNEMIRFTAQNSNPQAQVAQWYWNFGDGSTSSLPSTQYAYQQKGKYTVTLAASATNGCYSDTIRKEVSVFATQANAGTDTLVAAGQPVQLRATGGDFYRWSPSTGLSDPNRADPVAVLQSDIRYVLTASAAAGCATTDTITIKVVKGPAFYVPNAFTPNGDGKNDRFRFLPVGMQRVNYFRVYNRYGQLVYQSADPSRGWDGTVNGKLQAAGTFVWMVDGVDYDGQKQFYRGTVTLIR